MATPPDGEGTYSLVIELSAGATVDVGALGRHAFEPGWYVYTGSAFGPGGFARVERHRELARGERDARHWHVDYLLRHPDSAIRTVVTTADADIECAVARRLPPGPVDGFGASDCDCPTHLARFEGRDAALRAVRDAHEAATAGGADD
jgi:endonuclease-3